MTRRWARGVSDGCPNPPGRPSPDSPCVRRNGGNALRSYGHTAVVGARRNGRAPPQAAQVGSAVDPLSPAAAVLGGAGGPTRRPLVPDLRITVASPAERLEREV